MREVFSVSVNAFLWTEAVIRQAEIDAPAIMGLVGAVLNGSNKTGEANELS